MSSKEKFLDFEAANKQEWKELVIKELKGKPYENLVWDAGEGFTLDPLYTREELKSVADAFPDRRGEFNYLNSWTILQEYDNANLKSCNENIITGLTAGVQGVMIDGQKSEADYAKLLDGVYIDWIKLILKTKEGANELELYLKYAESKGINKKDIRGGLNYDPLNELLSNGDWKKNKEEDIKGMLDTVKAGSDLINFRTITVNASSYGDSGSSIVNELAYGLACYHEYLLLLTQNGISEEVALEAMQINLSIGRSFFMEIAKIKAFRILHAQLLDTYGLPMKEVNIISKSSEIEMAPTDQYTNLLRNTTQAMTAGIGGSNDVLLKSFDGENSSFSQRMSTNIQLLLIEESFLSKSVDVSSGSYVIEKMISDMASRAWDKFKQIESEGGWLTSVEKGLLQKDMLSNAKEKMDAINKKERTWLGVNTYLNEKEETWRESKAVTNNQGSDSFVKLHVIQHNF